MAERWIGFLLKVPVYHAAFVVGRVIAVAKDTAYFARSFLAWAKGSQVGTGTFDTSAFLMAKVFRVAITLAIGALGNVSFVIGTLKFNLTLLEVFYLKDIYVVGGGFEVHEKHGEGELGETVFDIEDVCNSVF
jgi:hypothetical protein